MRFNDGAADRESDSHAVGFGGVEGFEYLVGGVRGEADARILHAQPDLTLVIAFGSDEQLSWAVVNRAHCVRSIPEQI